MRSGDLRITFRPSDRFAASEATPVGEMHSAGVEQSNSTVVIGNSYVLKFYRRVVPGPSPEANIGAFLTDVARFPNSPALLGTIALIENGEESPLGVLHEFIENQGNAWDLTGSYLDRALDEARVLTAEPEPAAERHVAFSNRIRQIGRRVGELHVALAAGKDSPNFAPEPITRNDLERWTDALVTGATHVFDGLEQGRSRLDERARLVVDELLGRREAAIDRIRTLMPPDIDADKIRHHGDLHLGQILVAKDDAFIIDFEGEPNRPARERMQKAPSARDVAGVVRSLDYAATAALHRIPNASAEESARLDAFLDDWRRKTAVEFYAGVREAAGASRLWPQDDQAARALLRFFVVEKAIYEIGYELANRPDWVVVPLSGANRVLFRTEEEAK
jgi:maltose alpha-D-glucosyltransferase/alpha-amylase